MTVQAATGRTSSSAFANLLAKGADANGIDHILKTVRRHLGMDVAFVSHFRKDDRVFVYVDANGESPLQAGQTLSLEEGYCLRVVRGELPQLIPDTSVLPDAMRIPETKTIPIGAHLSVPIMLESGETYGTLCCFSYEPDLTLGERELKMMQALAEVLASRLAELQEIARANAARAAEVRAAMAAGAPEIVYQPLYRLQTRQLASLECLARFHIEPRRSPDKWFLAAHEVGLGQELELLAVRRALESLERFPAEIALAVNSSPELAISGQLDAAFDGLDLKRIILEITEHAAVADYEELSAALRPLRNRGLRLAIDDAGAGFASMRHILNLMPDQIKLDMTLTRDIDKEPSRRALARAMIAFAHDIGGMITAEGVETAAEWETLLELGVDKAQGYYMSKPVPMDETLRLVGQGEFRG